MLLQTKDKTQELLNTIWCDDYYVVAAGESAPSKSQLNGFAQKFGVKFPKEYVAHSVNPFGGLYLEVKEEYWPRASVGEVGPFWSFLYGLTTYAFSDEAPDWMRIDIAASEFKDMGHTVVPILKVMGDADVYCVNELGDIVRWSHEEDIFESFDGGFFDLLSFELKELEDRRVKKVINLSSE
ncbi:hypothetical protein L4D06_06850 [Enterovibrio makurazakiensis]|uniref:Knr4/Smi1-like domain-containing protein n=1 Tax=Enterovibrio gelatinilyticus TaxID=2899819 RepID=A0ABT5R5P3_9GAMM|nr:hypothetical protein [Enterovibrio sp. ZSDZ42]MDD1794802.1 hypothetical protein [Enterovibrio sp. ZSDZ42]